MKIANRFGSGCVYDIDNDVSGPVYILCTACKSIHAEALSWANRHADRMAFHPKNASAIVVLGCQVTDLAVLNDLRHVERLHAEYPQAQIYVGGCLSRRFDIDVGCANRIDTIRHDYHVILDQQIVEWAPPFWVEGWNVDLPEGNLFRDSYPLRISVGCAKSCSYCTIRITRGHPYELNYSRCVAEFMNATDPVLIADSPSPELLRSWIAIARNAGKSFSIRNIEPGVAYELRNDIMELSYAGLLKVFHCPIQSLNHDAIRDMDRNVMHMDFAIGLSDILRGQGVVTATNVIVDYKDFPNTLNEAKERFDHVSWNPYWNGVWDRAIAEVRWAKYFPWSKGEQS